MPAPSRKLDAQYPTQGGQHYRAEEKTWRDEGDKESELEPIRSDQAYGHAGHHVQRQAPGRAKSSDARRLRRFRRGLARSKARAFGMKSNADQIRMTTWLASPTNSHVRTSGCAHPIARATMSASSNARWAGIQNLRRETPPRSGWMRSGRRGQSRVDDQILVETAAKTEERESAGHGSCRERQRATTTTLVALSRKPRATGSRAGSSSKTFATWRRRTCTCALPAKSSPTTIPTSKMGGCCAAIGPAHVKPAPSRTAAHPARNGASPDGSMSTLSRRSSVGSARIRRRCANGARRPCIPSARSRPGWGATHVLMKTLKRVSTEMALHMLAYDLTRAMNLLGTGPLIDAMRA